MANYYQQCIYPNDNHFGHLWKDDKLYFLCRFFYNLNINYI